MVIYMYQFPDLLLRWHMRRPIKNMTKSARKWIVPVLAVFLSACLVFRHSQQDPEYAIIQAIIENIADYQSEIESWGYRVSVLYYYGFDQYALEVTYPETVPTFYPKRECVDALKIVRLQIYKAAINRAPVFENAAEPDSPSYYDVEVKLCTQFVSPENGEELHVSIDDAPHGYFTTRYCSNNFVDCKWFAGIDPASANLYADHHIKEVYSEAELLAHYRQGLELQRRLTALYHDGR